MLINGIIWNLQSTKNGLSKEKQGQTFHRSYWKIREERDRQTDKNYESHETNTQTEKRTDRKIERKSAT